MAREQDWTAADYAVVGIEGIEGIEGNGGRVLPDGGIEVGSVGKGPVADALTRRMADSMHRFHTRHRGGDVGFHLWPDQAPDDLAATATHPGVSLLARPHGTLSVSWPAPASPRGAQAESRDRPVASLRGRPLIVQPMGDAR